MTAGVYVYGVLAAADRAAVSVAGVEDAEVRTVAHDDVAAIVSDLGSETLNAAREVRAHWRVLEEACRQVTVLPVRFGTVMEDDREVRERVLAPHAAELADRLRELAGRVQLNVKGAYDEERLLREIVAASPEVAALRDKMRALPGDAGYYTGIKLGELVARQVEQRRAQDEQAALDMLGGLATDVRTEPPGGSEPGFKLAFLVERDGVDAFSAGVVRLGEALGERVHLSYVGPLPPYSFADADLSAGAPAWA